MSLFQFGAPLVRTPARPPCPKCAGKMNVTSIKQIGRGVDQRSFECDVCDYAEVILFAFQ